MYFCKKKKYYILLLFSYSILKSHLNLLQEEIESTKDFDKIGDFTQVLEITSVFKETIFSHSIIFPNIYNKNLQVKIWRFSNSSKGSL